MAPSLTYLATNFARTKQLLSKAWFENICHALAPRITSRTMFCYLLRYFLALPECGRCKEGGRGPALVGNAMPADNFETKRATDLRLFDLVN